MNNENFDFESLITEFDNDQPAEVVRKKPRVEVHKANRPDERNRANLILSIINEQATQRDNAKAEETRTKGEKALLEALESCHSTSVTRVNSVQNHSVQKLVVQRKFPGPAGLLPENSEDLSKVDETNSSEPSLNQSAVLCSQNTKDLFTQGAWRVMMNELPQGFLSNYEISSIKHGSRKDMKVAFLAGVIEEIHVKPANPYLVLRDSGDRITAVMHQDVYKEHCDSLEKGNVLLLRDVGLLRIGRCRQPQVLISLSDILAIYSYERRIVSTPHLETILASSMNSKAVIPETLNLDDDFDSWNPEDAALDGPVTSTQISTSAPSDKTALADAKTQDDTISLKSESSTKSSKLERTSSVFGGDDDEDDLLLSQLDMDHLSK